MIFNKNMYFSTIYARYAYTINSTIKLFLKCGKIYNENDFFYNLYVKYKKSYKNVTVNHNLGDVFLQYLSDIIIINS